MKKFLLALMITLSSLWANEAMLQPSNYKFVAMSIGQGKPYFLEVGAERCHSCQIMGKMLYKIKQEHPEYNIHFINVANDREVAQKLEVRMIPTQIIYDKEGKEVFRNIGVLSSEQLDTIWKQYGFEESK